MNNISTHLSYKEATHSETAVKNNILNIPTEKELTNMKAVSEKCFEPLRVWYGKPIKINSFFRSKELNAKVKGSKNSQHMTGQAIDMSAGSKEENKKLFDWCKDNLEFDQLIWEYDGTWIHISYKDSGNRKQILAIR